MLLPQLHDELAAAARRPHSVRRFSSRAARAFVAALLTLLVAAPAAQATLAPPARCGHTSAAERAT
jgi:hypothetical protein